MTMNILKATGKLQKLKVSVTELRIGMYVAELDVPWLESKFAMQGFEIKTQKQLDKIRHICSYVYIEQEEKRERSSSVDRSPPRKSLWQGMLKPFSRPAVDKSLPIAHSIHPPFSSDWISEQRPPQKTAAFAQEFDSADTWHREADLIVKSLMRDIYNGKAIDAKLAKEIVEDCVGSILRTPDTLMLLAQLKNRDQYAVQHSMNVCIFAVAFGRYLNLPSEHLNELGLSGLMHDMGKIKVPAEILNKPGKLDPEEMHIVRKHATWGRQILMETPGMPKIAVEVAHSHHEHCDGKGYPRRLTKPQITPFARIVAIADTYDAITSNRVYQDGCSHLDALRLLIEESRGHLDHSLVVGFIECLGIYPPGCLVLLGTGEIGIVTEINPEQRLRPKIIVVRDENKQLCEEKYIDLAAAEFERQSEVYTIRSVVKPDVYNIDINHYRQKGVFAMSN
jgi:HD-GYP domain-containing protein (c-di-GMP phosphodiesterase class II)